MSEPLKIAIGVSGTVWDRHFADALEKKRADGYRLRYDRVNIDAGDWLERLRPYDAVIWKPPGMGVEDALHIKEKVYALDRLLKKIIVPNYDTIWHFESKVAQSYLLAVEGVPTPATTVTFDYRDALQLDRAAFPLVFKKGEGSSSRNVRMVKDRPAALRLMRRAFCRQMYREEWLRGGPWYARALRTMHTAWFWEYVWQRLRGKRSPGYLYWQEFMAGNSADLRITVIGDCYAYGFWRNNRPNDFRASGSHRIVYDRPVPEECVRFCMGLSRRLNFDSMGYDILFRDGGFVISEICYGYDGDVPYHAPGHYRLRGDGGLEFVPGHMRPQALWVDWALQRCEKRLAAAAAVQESGAGR